MKPTYLIVSEFSMNSAEFLTFQTESLAGLGVLVAVSKVLHALHLVWGFLTQTFLLLL